MVTESLRFSLTRSARDPDLDPVTALTSREMEVLGFLCVRLTDREIADQLSISPRTVGSHVGRVIAKLGAANRREAAAIAAQRGWA
jgi:DNA-binding CsgD family transcriptional regulator